MMREYFIVMLVFTMMNSFVFGNEEPYWSVKRDPTIRMDNTKYYSTDLTLDKKTGDLTFFVKGKRDEQVELNIDYNFWDWSIANKVEAVTLGENVPSERFKTISMHTVSNRDGTIRLLPPYAPRPEPVENPFPKKRNGTIQLKKGDMYSKTVKIWELIIWDTLVKESEENKDLSYTLSIAATLKVGHQFYRVYPCYEIDHKTIRAMKNLKAALEKKEKENPPEEEKDDIHIPVNIYEDGKLIKTL